ncbi:ankyrin repeat domain-containing protein [Actinopolymorpha alba]|uniref:ankyrin repeat domain-containing protein n=1 Tax=Actinopolymorpha alba TaxID=533267 RepID=UPI0003660589|nr:ankyrin repeat domain-containing protein [Actinopolymorpha alba]
MPPRPLPDNPNLEHLKHQARALQQRVRIADPDALTLVREFDPRGVSETAGPSAYADFPLSQAQLVIAREYGFPGWRQLREHLDIVAAYSRSPQPVDELPAGAAGDLAALATHFLNLACLTYTRDTPGRADQASALLAAHPDLATATLHTMAAVGEIEGVREVLARDPEQAQRAGGPFDWEPLLYLAYSRLGDTGPGRSALEVARLLLAAGADPNAGYLWRGMPSPFTALTGAFGGGEQDQPPHPDSLALARLLLEAGADPNDNQTLYNRMFTPVNDHLVLLFEFGLGTETESPWRQRMGTRYPSPAQMLQEQLRWAADHGMVDRVRLLLDHGVDPDGLGYHPIFGDRTAYQLAVGAGHHEIARLLADAGAATTVDPEMGSR